MLLKPMIRGFAGQALWNARLTRPSAARRKWLTVVTFHRVLPEELRRAYPYPGLAVTPQELDWLLAHFVRYYTCGTLADMHRRFLRRPLPERPLLAITFDDGQLDNFEFARPVLRKHQVTASFFVPTQAVSTGQLLWHDQLGFAVKGALESAAAWPAFLRLLGEHGLQHATRSLTHVALTELRPSAVLDTVARAAKQLSTRERREFVQNARTLNGSTMAPDWAGMMSFDQVAILAQEGHEIGSHSVSHAIMTQCSFEELNAEMGSSKRTLEHVVEKPVESFCYPNGNCDLRTEAAAQEAGYARAVTTAWGLNSIATPPHALRRCDIDASRVRGPDGALDESQLGWRLSGLHPAEHLERMANLIRPQE